MRRSGFPVPIAWICLLGFAAAFAAVAACNRAASDDTHRESRTAAALPPANLGFLAAEGEGTPRPLVVPVPGEPSATCYAGGVKLVDLLPGSPLAKAGLRSGDVLFRVMDRLLPDKPDPTLDLLDRVEAAYAAGKIEITLGFARGDALQEAVLRIDPEALPPLDGSDDPRRSPRLEASARAGLAYLARAQNEGGTFPTAKDTPDAGLAVTAYAGLAFLGGAGLPGVPEYGEAVKRCFAAIDALLQDPEATHLGAAAAVLFLAEYGRAQKAPSAMACLAKAVVKILSAQREDGGWSLGTKEEEKSLGYNEATLATQLCLQALGTAERAGFAMDSNDPIERACAFLQDRTARGDVGYVPLPGFDRRAEAGRLAGIVTALCAIGCGPADSYVHKLSKYVNDLSSEIPRAPLPEACPMFHAALMAREAGLPTWDRFIRRHRVLLLSLQRPDGSFVLLPKPARKRLPFFCDLEGPAWRTALYTLIFLLQEDTLPLLACRPDPRAPLRDGTGKRLHTGASPGPGQKPPPGAKTMQFKSVDEAIEFLKKMGIDENDPQIQQLQKLQKRTKGGGK